MKLFIQALIREAHSRAEHLQLNRSGEANTLYFGGGTPSMLSDKHLGTLIEGLQHIVPIEALDEFSFEANPATFTHKKVLFWRSLGMSRVSLGIQSFDAHILHLLGREHSPEQALRSIHMLQDAGMPHINIDLMFAIPGQSLATWEKTIDQAIATNTDHISAYNLTYEEDTDFYRSLMAGEKFQDADEDAEYFSLADKLLCQAGFRHYETSNYAKNNAISPHNFAYWTGEDYVGIGPGAVSTIGGVRYENTKDTAEYIHSTLAHGLPSAHMESISAEDFRLERIALMLRTDEGLPLRYLSPSAINELSKFTELGLAKIDDSDRFILINDGKMLVDSIAAEIC